MKKPLLGVIVIIFSIFASFTITNTALAYFIGGHILYLEAPEITSARLAGYDCDMQGGLAITIYGIQGEFSYFIPGYVVPVTGYTPAYDQAILGIAGDSQTNIVCTRDEEKGVTSQTTIILDNIGYFGTSAI